MATNTAVIVLGENFSMNRATAWWLP